MLKKKRHVLAQNKWLFYLYIFLPYFIFIGTVCISGVTKVLYLRSSNLLPEA